MDYPALRERIVELMGEFPARCELEPVTFFREDCGDYFLEKISFRADPEEVVPAYVLTPKDLRAPAPAIVVNHSHVGFYAHGKSKVCGLLDPAECTNGEERSAVELCRRGYVCIAIDQKCFGERRRNDEDGGGYERFVFCEQLLRGSTLQARYVWDQSRAIDYLETRPEVDASRIGTVGLSLGGQQANALLFYDPRVSVGICACGVAPLSGILRDGILHNFALYLPGLLKLTDMDGLLATIAPRALMLIAGERDTIFPIDTVREMGEFLRKRYTELGAEDRFRLEIRPMDHRFPEDLRQMAWDWFDEELGRNP